jgi:hypothetical protein
MLRAVIWSLFAYQNHTVKSDLKTFQILAVYIGIGCFYLGYSICNLDSKRVRWGALKHDLLLKIFNTMINLYILP